MVIGPDGCFCNIGPIILVGLRIIAHTFVILRRGMFAHIDRELLCQSAGWIETDSGVGLRCSSRLEESVSSQAIHVARFYSLDIL